jgi:hypothetical protein
MSATSDWVATEFGQMAGLGYTAIHSNYGSIYSEGPPTAPGTPWLALGSADVASNGVKVFVGRHMNDTTTKIYRSQAGGETVALPGSDGLGGIVAVNDAGTIALLSGGSPEESGTLLQLFRNGSLETVLSAGDPLLGSTVSGIGFDPKGFNNAGQFALLVGLADGRDVYVLASPVPEPAAAAVACAVVGLMSLHRPRRRSA